MLLLTFLVKFCATELSRNLTSHQRPAMQAATEQNPVVSWEQCIVWMQNDPSVAWLPGWSGQILTVNNPFFPLSMLPEHRLEA